MGAKKKQAKLTEPEPDYQALFRTTPAVVFITTENGDLVDFSEPAVAFFGYDSRVDFAGAGVTSLFKKPSAFNDLISAAGQGPGEERPYEMLHKDRSVLPVLLTTTAVHGGDSAAVHYVTTVRQAAPRDTGAAAPRGKAARSRAGRTETPAHESGPGRVAADTPDNGEEFRLLFDTMSEGVALHELVYTKKGVASDYRIVQVNPAFETNTGIAADQARGKLSCDVYGSGKPPFLDIYTRVATTGNPESFEIYFEPLGRHFRIRAFSPKKGWFATVFSDITKRKRLEEESVAVRKELEEQNAVFTGILSSTDADIFSLDREIRYTSYNQAHAATMKALYGTEIAPGTCILDHITLEKDQKTIRAMAERALGGEAGTEEVYAGDNALSRQYRDLYFNPIRNTAGDITGVAVISRNATERKRAEKALRLSEERYRRLTENSQDIIFRLVLPDHRFEYINPACLTLTGYEPAEFYTSPHLLQDIIHPVFHERLEKQWAMMPKGDVPQEYEYSIIHRDGRIRWFHQRNTVVRDSKGKVTALEGIVTDITARKNAEISLREIEERYRIISENTADVIWLLNLATMRFSYVSPSVFHLLGYTAEEILEMSFVDFLTPASREYVEKAIPAAIEAIRGSSGAERIQNHIVEQVRKDGTIITVEIVATLLNESEPDRIEILGVSRDISERKRAQEALRESEEKFRSLVETTSDLVWEVDAQGIYTYVSPKVRDLLGYEPAELVGKTPFSVMPPDEAERLTREFELLAVSPSPVDSLVNRCLHKNGTVVVMETSAVPLFARDGSFAGFRGIDRDVTERIRIGDALKESEERYRSFVERANEAIFVIQDGLIPFCNRKGMDLIGREADYLATHSFLDLIHPDDRNAAVERHVRRLKGEDFDPLAELRVMNANGTLHWLEINAVQISWNGKPATLNFATEITERKKAYEALRESETSYHGLFNTVKEAIFIEDADGRFLNVNDGAVAMYGYPREFFIGKTPAVLSAEGRNDLDALTVRLQQAFEGEPQTFEFWGKRSTGEVFPKEVRLYKGSYFGKDILIAVATDITERKQAEAAIRESEHHYHLLADNVSDVIWTAGREMQVTYISPSITALTGHTPEEFMRLRPEDSLTPDSLALLHQSREEVLGHIAAGHFDACRPQSLELEYIRKDGSTVWAEVVISLIRGSSGEPQGVIGVTRDITDRKQTDEALKNSEEYLQTIINSVQTGLVIIDPETHTIIDVNPAAERLAGVPREKMIGAVCHRFICPAEVGSCPVTDLGMSVDNSERTLITPDGPRSILKTVVQANFSGERYLLESFIDITDRKQAEEKLVESEEKFSLIFKNSNDAIYLFEITPSGMPGRIVDANDVALGQTGLPKDTLLRKSFLEIHSGELPRKSRPIMMELLTKGNVRFEADVARHDGTKLPVEVSAQFAKLNQKTYVIAISRDVSRRKREDRALRIANQKLQLMNLVAWHDIQNKVTGLRGYVELSKDFVMDEQMKKFIASEEEVLKVIHQQLQYTKEYQEMGVHPQEWVNISQTLRMVLSLAEMGTIQVIIDVADLEIFCDPVIAKVFSHLLDNTKIHGKKATSIHISCRETADGLTLLYEDDGVGIPEEQKKELFMRNVGTTTGFSLFFIHDLLEVSEMTIHESGVFGQGVRFEIGIPRGMYRFGHKP